MSINKMLLLRIIVNTHYTFNLVYLRHYMDYFTWVKAHSLLGGVYFANYLGDSENLIVCDSDSIRSSFKKKTKIPQHPTPHIYRRINTNNLWTLSWYFSAEWNRVCFYTPFECQHCFGELGWKRLPCSYNLIFLGVQVLEFVVVVGFRILVLPKWSSCTGSGLISSWCLFLMLLNWFDGLVLPVFS